MNATKTNYVSNASYCYTCYCNANISINIYRCISMPHFFTPNMLISAYLFTYRHCQCNKQNNKYHNSFIHFYMLINKLWQSGLSVKNKETQAVLIDWYDQAPTDEHTPAPKQRGHLLCLLFVS